VDEGETLKEVVECIEAYEISDGHRRYIASGMVGITELPCIIKPPDEDAALDDMLTANLEREDNTPAEEGWLFMRLVDERGWGIEQLMRTFHKSEGYINDRVRLVCTDGEVAKAVATHQIPFSVAKALLRCTDEAHRRYLLGLCVTHGANTRTAESYVHQWKVQSEAQPQVVGGPGATSVGEYIPPPAQLCLWCERDEQRESLVSVVVHSWHLRDLLVHLERTGVRSATTSA